MLSCYFLSLSSMSPVPLHQGVRLSLSTTSAGCLHWPAWSCPWGAAAVLCHTMYPTHETITVVWTCLNLRCLNTPLVTELTISDVWQWSCLLAIRFTVEVLCLYFCRYMAKAALRKLCFSVCNLPWCSVGKSHWWGHLMHQIWVESRG